MNELQREKIIRGIEVLIIMFVVFMQYYQFQKSVNPSSINLAAQGIYLVINLSILVSLNMLVAIFVKKWYIVLSITSAVCFIWSIVNHYVYLFHGTPLYLSALRSVNAAKDIMGNYDIVFSEKVMYILLCAFAVIVAIIVLFYMTRKRAYNKKKSRGYKIGVLLANIVFIIVCFLGGISSAGGLKIGASWNAAIRNYGFLCCFIGDINNVLNPVECPKNYSVEQLKEKLLRDEEQKTNVETSPSIILILNESYCDLGVETDIDYMEPLSKLQNAVLGTGISSMVGGGTNNSEYELLTSNSMYLLRSEAPFNYLDMTNHSNNVVSYLEALGYTTAGMHCGLENSYSRQKAYPEMGFDDIYLGESQFTSNSYGNRKWLDSDNYSDLIHVYEEKRVEGKPQFIYMLTLQNHGGFEQNEERFDLVHAKDDFGDLTDDLNEYLTSVYMSNNAFIELTQYFSAIDEPVIVGMIGDHAPAMIGEVREDNLSNASSGREVPYIIWANYDVDYTNVGECITMTDFVPMIMDVIDFPMSSYYQAIRELHQVLPIRTSFGAYVDNEGNEFGYNEDNPYYEDLLDYYWMEYNSIVGGEDYIEELFAPQ